jgi:penicillin-insensitive murein endopeptidase
MKAKLSQSHVRAMRSLFPTLLALTCGGCFGTPTPLAPNLRGSVGVPHHGVLTGGKELPKDGVGFARFRPTGKHNWGNPRLVQAISDAADAVNRERPGGTPLMVGDLSARYGGKIRPHNSHRTGRDVDLLWYVTTPDGIPVKSPGFVRLSADGLGQIKAGGDYVRLDIERQWLLVRALLESPYASIQWIFCSREIEALLIDYALSRGENMDLIWHAEAVLLEPSDSLPHDDHIHVRITCSASETVDGCEGGGPYWDWLPPLPSLGPVDAQLLSEIAADDPVSNEDKSLAQAR